MALGRRCSHRLLRLPRFARVVGQGGKQLGTVQVRPLTLGRLELTALVHLGIPPNLSCLRGEVETTVMGLTTHQAARLADQGSLVEEMMAMVEAAMVPRL